MVSTTNSFWSLWFGDRLDQIQICVTATFITEQLEITAFPNGPHS